MAENSMDQASTAGKIGGGRDGRFRQSRIFLIASGRLMAHRIRIFPRSHHIEERQTQKGAALLDS